MSPGALNQMTEEQKAAILRLATLDVQDLEVYGTNPFGLPPGYLAFRQAWEDGHSIYGGIAPDGQVST